MIQRPSSQKSAWATWPKAFALTFMLMAVQAASAGQEQLAASMGETRNEVIATRDQLQSTVDALDALVKQKEGDLKPGYDGFVQQVSKTQATAELTKSRAKKMETDAKMHFEGWQKEIDGVANESLRKKGQKRLDNVQKSYNRTIATLQGASTGFEPFLSDLGDVKKILANDLTKDGLKSIRSTVSQAKFDLRIVRSHLFDAIKELDSMQNSLSSAASK